MPPVVTRGENSVAITMTRPSPPTRPPRARTPVVAATSQSTDITSTAPSLKPTIEITAAHEKVSSSASQRARVSNHSTTPVRPITARPTAAAAGWIATSGCTASITPPVRASAMRTRAAYRRARATSGVGSGRRFTALRSSAVPRRSLSRRQRSDFVRKRPPGTATIARMGTRGSILVVDDEPTIADVVSRYLVRAGYSTRVASDGPAALRSAGEERPDLVVLDLMLPGMDGLDVMRRLRALGDGPRMSVILLTAKGEHSDRIVGLRLGADDYVVKPFSPAELVARVDAVLRRTESKDEPAEPIVFDGLAVDPAARRVTVRGEEAQLTVREFDLLAHLVRHPGQVFSRDQLMDAVWEYSFYTDTSTVTVHMRRLRAKIEADPGQPRWLQTVWGVGYRFEP